MTALTTNQEPVWLGPLPDNWLELQRQVSAWATYNFGEVSPWQPMLGICEEVAEFLEDPGSGHEDAIGDQAIYAVNLAQVSGANFAEVASRHFHRGVNDRVILIAIGSASHVVLKHSQGIRGVGADELRAGVEAFLGSWFQWAYFQTISNRLRPPWECARLTWGKVRLRDWKADPVGAGAASEKQDLLMMNRAPASVDITGGGVAGQITSSGPNRKFIKKGQRLWFEDDATTHDPDHENLNMAWARLFHETFDKAKAVTHIDLGDADVYQMLDGRVAISSYPGNSEIWSGVGAPASEKQVP